MIVCTQSPLYAKHVSFSSTNVSMYVLYIYIHVLFIHNEYRMRHLGIVDVFMF